VFTSPCPSKAAVLFHSRKFLFVSGMSLCSARTRTSIKTRPNSFQEVHLDASIGASWCAFLEGRLVVAQNESALGALSHFQAMAGGSSPGKTRPGLNNQKTLEK
jgi:hypothetical protein